MGDSSSGRNDNELRAEARRRIGEGKLPRAKAIRTWGGLGSGLPCDLCGAPISQSEPEFELQFDTTPSPGIRFHRQCHSVWESVRHEPASEQEHWIPVAHALPPAGIFVEVRWEMGDSRTIILGCTLAREATTSERLWINLTTKAPLPHGWRPIEWRPSPLASQPLEPAGHLQPSVTKRA